MVPMQQCLMITAVHVLPFARINVVRSQNLFLVCYSCTLSLIYNIGNVALVVA
jgi:hypothetical protein